MRAVSAAASGARHIVGVTLQAFVIFAIIAALLIALSPINKAADILAGTELAAAGGKLTATLTFGGASRLGAIGAGAAMFEVTRSTPDNDPVMWVTTKCYDAYGVRLSWLDLPVNWGTDTSLAGTAGPHTISGTSCKSYATLAPWRSRVLGSALL